MSEKIQLPQDKQEKVILLHEMYLRSTMPHDMAIFKQILDGVTGTSLRMLKQYKTEFKWKRHTPAQPREKKIKVKIRTVRVNPKTKQTENIAKPINVDPETLPAEYQLPPPSEDIKIIRALDSFTDTEKGELLKTTCRLYKNPKKSLMQVCDEVGIILEVFTEWVNMSPIWRDMWLEAEKAHMLNHSFYCQSKSEERRVAKLEGYKELEILRFVDIEENYKGEEIRTTSKEMLRIKDIKADKWDLMEAGNTSREYRRLAEAGAPPVSLDIKSMDDQALRQLLKELGEEENAGQTDDQ